MTEIAAETLAKYVRAVPKEYEYKEKGVLTITDELYQYILDVSVNESPLKQALRKETQKDSQSVMQISPDQGQLMSMIVKLTGARKILEIGVFTGYSSLCMATALPDDGKIVACDISEKWTSIARTYRSLSLICRTADMALKMWRKCMLSWMH